MLFRWHNYSSLEAEAEAEADLTALARSMSLATYLLEIRRPHTPWMVSTTFQIRVMVQGLRLLSPLLLSCLAM